MKNQYDEHIIRWASRRFFWESALAQRRAESEETATKTITK